jgi:ligand-binding sensor protein
VQKPNFTLTDILDIKGWQKIQDNFAAVTEVGIRTLDRGGKNITETSFSPRLNNYLKNYLRLKQRICGSCLPTFLGGSGVVDKNLHYSCDPGLSYFLAPLYVQQNIVLGYLIVGPVILIMRQPKEHYQKLADELEKNLEEIWGVILEMRVISTHAARSLVELVKNVCQNLLNSRYALMAREKENIIPDSRQLPRLLEVLLDVAFQVSGADVGSIMSYNKKKKELTIQSSRGIPREIADKTRVKIGEGISGMAAKQKSYMLIDSSSADAGIKPFLNRPRIKSSMILPINCADSLLGVMNLGATEKASVMFNEENVNLINKLINLTTLALQPLQSTN